MGLRGFAAPALVLLGVVLLASTAEASHFRYGTISWRPGYPTLNKVEIFFEAAYRRDFEWGKFFREQWAVGPTDNPDWVDGGSCYTSQSCTYLETAPAVPESYYQFFSDVTTDYTGGGQGGWYIKLATGRSYYELITANNRQCESPFDTGDRPTCPDGVPEGTYIANGNYDPVTGLPVPYFLNQELGDAVPCETSDNVDPDYCSPWSQTYGFFFGDDNYTDIILTITDINHEDNYYGNFLLGTSFFEHTYSAPKKDKKTPWTAYFTGGNRIAYSTDALNNNGQGRFRLEITINIQGFVNLSPTATSFPVLPVPYTGRGGWSAYGMLSTFQISAYDSNFEKEAFLGGKELYNEEVFFFIANSRKHGVLLANQVPDLKYPSRWYKDRYEEARIECYNISCKDANGTIAPYPGGCGNCKKGAGKICATTTLVTDNGQTEVRKLEFSCEAYPPWDNNKNLAHAPPRMSMNVTTGVVQWETGVNPYHIDNDTYYGDWDRDGDGVLDQLKNTKPGPGQEGYEPLEQGFYNLVVDIRSSAHDPECEEVATESPYFMTAQEAAWACHHTNLTNRNAPDVAYISTPLDFLLYLYPIANWCSKPTCLNSQPGITTFRDFGFYGDAQTPEEEIFQVSDYKYDAPGTGKCTICGGGLVESDLTNHTKCLETNNCGFDATVTIVPSQAVCFRNTFPLWVNQSNPGVDDGNTPTALPHMFFAEWYGKRGKPVTFNLIATDMDQCVELSIHPTGLHKGYTMYNIGADGFPDYSDRVCSYQESVTGNCGFDMTLSNHTRVGTDGRTVKRVFHWPAKKTPTDPDYEQELDPRPPNVTVCFFPFDNYAVGPFRCVNIVLTSDKELYWRDQRPQLKDHGEGFLGPTPANETTFYVAPGNTLSFTMSAKQGTGYAPIKIWVSQGELPEGSTFEYTEPDPKLRDPATRNFVWTPEEGDQCEYLICFIGNNTREDPQYIDYTHVYEPSGCIGGGEFPCLDERCYTIVVMDQTMDFAGGTYVTGPDSILQALTAECGMSIGVWFLPEGTTSMPIITMGYSLASTPGTKEMVHQLSWEPVTKAEFNDLVTSQDLGQYYRLVYTSGLSQVTVMTDPDFCIDEWHFAMVTIEPNGHTTLYLDGVQTYHYADDTRDFHQIDVIDTTTSVPVTDGKVEIIGTILGSKPGSTGFFHIGSYVNPFDGKITDVRVYSRALSSAEVAAKMFTVLEKDDEIGLEVYYKFNEGSQAAVALGNSAGGYNKYGKKRNSTETKVQGDTTGDTLIDSPLAPYETEMSGRIIHSLDPSAANSIVDYSGHNRHGSPCPQSVAGDLHYEFMAAPTMPACPKEFSPDNVHVDGGKYITISGTGFARSQFLKCSFSMQEGFKIVKAEYINNSTIICRNPGAKYVTASMLEVTNGAYYSDLKIPIYMMERAISFPESGGSVLVPDICSNLGEMGFSMGGWVYPLSESTGTLFKLQGPEGVIEVTYQQSNFLVAEKLVGGARNALGVSDRAAAHMQGEGAGWHYVMLTASSLFEFKLYVDGEEFSVASPSVQFVQSTCDLVVGDDQTAIYGLVEEVSMWSKHLSLCQSYQVMWGNLTAAPLCPEGDSIQVSWNDRLESYLKMNDFGNIAKDTSGSQNNGILSGDASFMFTTVPFKAPSFNRPRPRTGPPSKQFDYGPNALMMENYTIPRSFHSYYDYIPFMGRFEEELQPFSLEGSLAQPRSTGSLISVDGLESMAILGFGFAESKWLKCEMYGELTDVVYVGVDEVHCTVPPAPYPGYYNIGVLNMYPDHETCEAEYWGKPAHRLINYVPNGIEMKEAVLEFDGEDDYAFSSEVAAAIGNEWDGVTFGAWFYPMDDDVDKEQPIMCFTTACASPAPPPPSPSPPPPSPAPCENTETSCEVASPPPSPSPPPPPLSPPPFFDTYTNTTVPYVQVCMMYKNQMVYIQSDLTSDTYNNLYFNATAGFPANTGEWHYAEITIDGVEIQGGLGAIISDDKNSTGNIPTYIAKMTVDGNVVDGSPAGDIRVPIHPASLALGGFFVGGEGCDESDINPFFADPPFRHRRSLLDDHTSDPQHFKGYIDEVRVFRGVVPTDWFHRLGDQDVDLTDLVAHYRMSDTAPGVLSQNLYQHMPIGPYIADASGNDRKLGFFEFGNTTDDDPKYVYSDVPYEAATTYTVNVTDMMLKGHIVVEVDGYNIANSQWLGCAFYTMDMSDSGVSSFTKVSEVPAMFINNGKVKCMAPDAPFPTIAYVQVTNPKAVEMDRYEYMESALEFEGDRVKSYEVIGGTANENEVVDLQCPTGMRMDKVLMASYGRPKHRCNAKHITNCDLSKTFVPCDYMQYEVNDSCHSDHGKPPHFTVDVVEKYCLGKSTCSIPALNSEFGDPCPSSNKWLSVAMRCSDRWETKDYVQADAINTHLDEGSFSFSAWVFPHSKPGVQSIVSFGGAPGQDLLNRHILQWRGDLPADNSGVSNTGRFYYYDDCIYDVIMKYDDGRDIVLASNQWYKIFLTKDAYGNGKMFLNGFETAHFTTACKPDVAGNFFLGMDLSDEMMPKEYFDGLMDEVMVFKYAFPLDETVGTMCWTASQLEQTFGAVAYYKFNFDSGELTEDFMGNVHGVLASSAETIWDPVAAMWTTNANSTWHTDYTYVGAPWYPTSTMDIKVPGGTPEEPGPLMGGAEVTITGLNFSPINSRVFYMDEEILYEFVDHRTMTATIPDLKDPIAPLGVPPTLEAMSGPPTCSVGGTYEFKVINSLGPLDEEACSVGVGSITEEVTYTQALEVKDLQQGLICYFPFYADANDYSGHAKHASNFGGSLVVNRNGYPDQAYAFAAEDYIGIESCTGGKTVAMWIYYEDIPYPSQFTYLDTPLPPYEPATGCQASDLATINNAWTHVVGVLDGGVVEKIYVNGHPSTNTKLAEQIVSVLVDKKIGGDDFVGKVDDVWIWDRVLCDSEIVETYAVQEYALEFGFGTELSIPLASPAQGSHGLLAHFFGAGIEHFEVLDVLQQDYAAVAPASGFSVDEWSVELTGYIYAPYSSEYYFTISADDSFRLWINKGEPITAQPDSRHLEEDWVTIGDGPLLYDTTSTWTSVNDLWVETPEPSVTRCASNSCWKNVINEPCIEPECQEREVMGNIELNQGWYPIYMSYTDKRNSAGFSLRWQTTDGDITKQLISAEYLRSGTGPFTVEAWVWPYTVDGDHTVVSRTYMGLNGLGFGINDGGMSASIYTGCFCSKIECDEYREVNSWKTVVKANTWQHIAATYDGKQWMLYVNEILLDTIYYQTVKFLPETPAPIVLGKENDQQVIAGLPDEIRQFYGQIYSFAMFSEVRKPSIKCPHTGPEANLVAYLQLHEGVGLKAYDFSGKTPTEQMFLDGVIVAAPEPQRLWQRAICGTWGTDPSKTEIAGTALTQAIAGHCAVFTLASFDQCGHKKLVGGDAYKVEIVGPLHLHTETITLTVGDGIVDHEDGSYTVTFNREASGYYMIKVYLVVNNVDIKLDTFKTYVHPYIADAGLSYMFDDLDDPLYLDELESSMAGIPVSFKLQTVDVYGNLRTEGGITDWEITFSGPYDFNGTWADNYDGTYTFHYTAQVAGHYKMMVKMAGAPICTYGGSTCCGGTKSAYSYCTMNKEPQSEGLSFEKCLFCITVYDGSSLALGASTVHATFPDSDALDLENPFSVFAFIKKDNPTGETHEYIVSKMSDYSGKGYFLGLEPTSVAGEYVMMAGVYIGSENFRTVKETVALPYMEWVHVGMTYTGKVLSIYVDAVLVESNTFDDDGKYQKRSTQPLNIGKGFGGLIDNVMIYDEVKPVEDFVSHSFCPANMKNRMENWENSLIAYYRFNENSGFATKDHSHLKNDGIVGLVCDIAAENKHTKLVCPTGYMISDILYANFGENDGSCGDFTPGDCSSEASMAFVTSECLGKESCTILASKENFPTSCHASAKSLAINAVCTSNTVSSWSLDTAPTLVAVTHAAVEDLICPQSLIGTGIMPAWLEADLQDVLASGADCKAGADITTAEAGKLMVWGMVAQDGCGYRSLHGTDIFDGEISWPMYYDLKKQDQCPDFSKSKFENQLSDFVAGSQEHNYCGTYNDLYMMYYIVNTTGVGRFTFNMNDEPIIDDAVFTVVPAPISPAFTSSSGSGMTAGEAGIETMFTVTAYDGFGNLRNQYGDEGTLALSVSGPATVKYKQTLGPKPGQYLYYVTYPVAGEYTVTVTCNGVPISETTAVVTETLLRPITALNTAAPQGRFEHSAVQYKDEVYYFGGALADKTYLDETVKFSIGVSSVEDAYSYRKMVNVQNMPASDYTVELMVDTATLISEGKLKADCSDLYFFSFAGAIIDMWIEPKGAPAGCGKADAVVWIKVPGGMSQFYMYYGNKAAPSVSNPHNVFTLFEDFEYTDSPSTAGWGLDVVSDDTCDTDPGYNPGDIASFYTSDVTSIHGSRSLKVDTVDMVGGSLSMAMPTMKKFTMKAYMYDSGCEGAHWISPDYEVCQPIVNSKSMLPSMKNGAGIYTASAEDVYCTSYPWRASPSQRSIGWHSLTFRDDDKDLTVMVDEYTALPLRSNDVTTDLTKVFLRSSKLPDTPVGSSVYWDAIMVTAYDETVSTSLDAEETVQYEQSAVWSTVGSTNPPPARQAHSAVIYSDAMYVFGGERSAYEYGDLWKYTFATDGWEFIPTVNSSASLGRHDHSAVVYGDAMYVYGGRSPMPLNDLWMYSFTSGTWTELPNSPGMAPRFGHTAAVSGGKMYVYGGYVHSGEGALTDEIWSWEFETHTWTKVGPRYDNFEEEYIVSPTDAIIFPMDIPAARFSHSSVLTGKAPALYVIGGAGGAMMMDEMPSLWKFDLASLSWTKMMEHSLLGRYDSSAVLFGDGKFVLVYGGHADGKFLSDSFVIYVGETGY